MAGELVPMTDVAAIAAAHGIELHLDAARLLLAARPRHQAVRRAVRYRVPVALQISRRGGRRVLAASRDRIAAARELRRVYGGMIYQGWMPALIAAESLKTFPERIARALP